VSKARRRKLETWQDVLRELSCNQIPVVFVAATSALLDGMEQWVGSYERLSLTDSFDGAGHIAAIATGMTPHDFSSYEACLAYLFDVGLNPLKGTFASEPWAMTPDGANLDPSIAEIAGFRHARASMVQVFERDLLEICKEAKTGCNMVSIGVCESYSAFRKAATSHRLAFTIDLTLADEPAGQDAVDVSSESDWDALAPQLSGRALIGRKSESLRRYAAEMVVTGSGHAIAPVTRVALERGWDRTQWAALSVLRDEHDIGPRLQLRMKRIGDALLARGFHGAISVEFSEDQGDNLTVEKLTPRLSEHSLLAHAVTTFHGGFPIHLLHILECLHIETDASVSTLHQRYQLHDDWSVIAIRHTSAQSEMITRAPASGLYHLEQGNLEIIRRDASWASASGNTGYFLRLQNIGNYRAAGTLLGLLYLRKSALTERGDLSSDARQWIAALQVEYSGLPVSGSSLPPGITRYHCDTYL
jgi:hypothetical protein